VVAVTSLRVDVPADVALPLFKGDLGPAIAARLLGLTTATPASGAHA
jgi:hypothetical protein